MGYYDRNGFPNILRNAEAPVFLDQNIRIMQIVLGNLMWTTLVNGEGSTQFSSQPEGRKYLNNKYDYSSDYYSWWTLTDNIKDEIRAWRPTIVSLLMRNGEAGHAVVAHWFNGNDFYVNFGWWAASANATITTDGNNFEENGESWRIRRVDTVTIWDAI